MSKLNLNKWMSEVDDSMSIFLLSLPGTHDTMTYQGYWGITGGTVQKFTQTQTLSLDEQLNSGVRFLDLRVGENMVMYHGIISLKSRFDTDVIPSIRDFLEKNPSETLVLRVKDEENPPQEQFDKQLGVIIDKNRDVFVDNDNQSLFIKDIRGRAVVLDNTSTRSFSKRNASPVCWGNGAKMMMQDNYDNPSYEEKFKEIAYVLDESNKSDKDIFYINHVSATGKIPLGRKPSDYAKNLNPKTLDYITTNKVERAGVLIFDFINEDISADICKINF